MAKSAAEFKKLVKLLTPEQVADILQCPQSTLAAQRRLGEGPPYVRVRSRIRYPQPALLRWIDDWAAGSTAAHEQAREDERTMLADGMRRRLEEAAARLAADPANFCPPVPDGVDDDCDD
jgi:hypothetical protein